MRNIQTASIVLAALLILPVKGLASPASRTHEVTGVVTFMDATTLAIRQRPVRAEHALRIESVD